MKPPLGKNAAEVIKCPDMILRKELVDNHPGFISLDSGFLLKAVTVFLLCDGVCRGYKVYKNGLIFELFGAISSFSLHHRSFRNFGTLSTILPANHYSNHEMELIL